MTKQPDFLVRVQNGLGTIDVPCSGMKNSIEAAQKVQEMLRANHNSKIIAVYENVGNEDHWNEILKIK